MAPVRLPYFTLLFSQSVLKCAPLIFQLAELCKKFGPVDGLSMFVKHRRHSTVRNTPWITSGAARWTTKASPSIASASASRSWAVVSNRPPRTSPFRSMVNARLASSAAFPCTDVSVPPLDHRLVVSRNCAWEALPGGRERRRPTFFKAACRIKLRVLRYRRLSARSVDDSASYCDRCLYGCDRGDSKADDERPQPPTALQNPDHILLHFFTEPTAGLTTQCAM
jgi:hypothetical protein